MMSYAWGLHIAVVLMTLAASKPQSSHFPLWNDLHLLPRAHLEPYFYRHRYIKDACSSNDACPFQKESTLPATLCWGYELECDAKGRRINHTRCPGEAELVHPDLPPLTKTEQENKFWKYGDFGNVKAEYLTMSVLCPQPNHDDSYLSCSKYGRVCRARNFYLDLRDIKHDTIDEGGRLQNVEHLFRPGQVGGHCNLNVALKDMYTRFPWENYMKDPRSWYGQILHYYEELDFRPYDGDHCDITIERPSIIVRWPFNSGYNLYDHMIDFLSVYMTQHVSGSFNIDINIIVWRTHPVHVDYFKEVWPVFTDHPIYPIGDLIGQRVCFKELMLGMSNNLNFFSPLVSGCKGSSLFKAFSQHMIHRLNVPSVPPRKKKVRVTLMVRRHGNRKTLNLNAIIRALEFEEEIALTVADFNEHVPFVDTQLKVSHNTDVLVGVHGAGLTHMMFMPDWGAVVELYHCGHILYTDLARLCGLRHFSWTNETLITDNKDRHPPLEIGKEFTNTLDFHFDVKETMRLVRQAVKSVMEDQRFKDEMVGARQARDQNEL